MIKNKSFFYKQTLKVDKSAGIIPKVVILQSGKDKYGDNFDRKSLEQLILLANAQGQGVKSRFGHPNACDSSLGSYLGRFKNFNISTNPEGKEVVVADLILDDIASRSPKGNLKDYVLEMAERNDDMFGNSIVYNAGEKEYVTEKDLDGNEIKVPYERFKSFIASDLVDSPAATTSLFKDTDDLAYKATQFLDSNPDIYEVILKDESILNSFLNKFNQYKKEKNKMNLKKTIATKLKELSALIDNKQKDFDMNTADGMVVTITDNNDDGKPTAGDICTMDGVPCALMTMTMEDGSEIVTDENGAIVSVTPNEPAEDVPAQQSELSKSYNDLKQKYEDLISEVEAERKQTLKSIEALEARLSKIKSVGNPEVSSATQFKKSEETKKTSAEIKAEIEAQRKKK